MVLTEDQVNNLMDLLKIPSEKQNFEELRNQIKNLIEEKKSLNSQTQFKNDKIQIMGELSPLEKILKTPGLIHLAEKVFGNFDDVKICRDINQSSREILDNPMFWLKKFESLSKKNRKDWIKVIKSVKNSEKEKAIISYLQWNLRKNVLQDLPCYSSSDVQDEFLKQIWQSCWMPELSDENMEIVKILAPLTDNPNAPTKNGKTSSSLIKFAEFCRILNTSRKRRAVPKSKPSMKRAKKF